MHMSTRMQAVARAMQPGVLPGFNRTRVAMFCRGLARLDYQPSREVVSTLCACFEEAHGPVSHDVCPYADTAGRPGQREVQAW